jgi:hypothetical protein
MIIAKICGGLGNQMFQWAFARSLATERKEQFIIDASSYNSQQGLTQRKFELNAFTNLNIDLDQQIPPGQWAILKDGFNYLETLGNIQRAEKYNVFLDGYWQSEKYFEKHKSLIYSDFSPSFEEVFKCQKLIEPDSISIHVRRTDYVNLQAIHPVQPISYFNLGIDLIGDYNKLYVFSDEIDWCKTNLNYPRMVFMEGGSAIEDMRLMSFCKHNIISNSTFSWWAAWLNQNPQKIVVAPKKWFGSQANINSADIIPNEWKTI